MLPSACSLPPAPRILPAFLLHCSWLKCPLEVLELVFVYPELKSHQREALGHLNGILSPLEYLLSFRKKIEFIINVQQSWCPFCCECTFECTGRSIPKGKCNALQNICGADVTSPSFVRFPRVRLRLNPRCHYFWNTEFRAETSFCFLSRGWKQLH